MNRYLNAATVQFQHTPGDVAANLAVVRRFVEQAAPQGTELIVFPEMCLTGYWHVRKLTRAQVENLAEPVPEGPLTRALLELARTHNISIGAGLIERAPDGKLYNTYVVVMPDGRHARHRKIHMFISEYLTCGSEYTVFTLPCGWRAGILICYDNNIIENARTVALMGADVLIAPHQTGGCRSRSPRAMGAVDVDLWENRERDSEALAAAFRGPKGRGWLMRWLPSRAHDNGMFLLFSNGVGRDDDEVRTGNAMIIDCYGELMNESASIGDDMVTARLDATELENCTGRRWIRVRRPELYGKLVEGTGHAADTRRVRLGE